MKVTVRIYGTLSRVFHAYTQEQGMEVELSDGAKVKDLLTLLEIPESQRAVVAIDGRLQRSNDIIPEGAHAQVFQPVHGG